MSHIKKEVDKIFERARKEKKSRRIIHIIMTHLITKYQQGIYQTPEDFKTALKLAFKGIIERLKATKNRDQPFSRVGWHINADPELFLLAGMPKGEARSVVRTAFKHLHMVN